MANTVHCPLCGKEIGKQVIDGTHSLPNLGGVTMMHSELDYQKASHIYWNAGRYKKSGVLCKRCAKAHFPDGKAYYVVTDYHGKWYPVSGGDVIDCYFSTKLAADRRAFELNRKHGGGYTTFEKAI